MHNHPIVIHLRHRRSLSPCHGARHSLQVILVSCIFCSHVCRAVTLLYTRLHRMFVTHSDGKYPHTRLYTENAETHISTAIHARCHSSYYPFQTSMMRPCPLSPYPRMHPSHAELRLYTYENCATMLSSHALTHPSPRSHQ